MKQSITNFILRHRILATAKGWVEALPAVLGSGGDSKSWSQHGEDSWLLEKLGGKEGYYVDVGANHPNKLSNTYRLYSSGMRGITVDPNRDMIALHERVRPRDLQVCCGIGASEGLAPFFEFSQHVLSTYDPGERKELEEMGKELKKITYTPVFRLDSVLKGVAGELEGAFQLLSVDTEGLDLIVLESNDWERFRPALIVVESKGAASELIEKFLISKGYAHQSNFGVNGVYADSASGAPASS